MTVTDQIKILDRMIMENEAQYYLDIKAAKISAFSSNSLDKYEYLTGEDLGLKESTVEQAKFEYSPLGKVFDKGLEEDKKEGLLKRLNNIEDYGKKQLDTDSQSLKAIDYFSKLSPEAKELYLKNKKGKTDIDPEKFVCIKTNGTILTLINLKIH